MNGEIVPFDVNEKDLKDEVLRRNARAGYTTRFGEPPHRTKIMNFVPENKKQYDENYKRIFGHD